MAKRYDVTLKGTEDNTTVRLYLTPSQLNAFELLASETVRRASGHSPTVQIKPVDINSPRGERLATRIRKGIGVT